MKKVFAALLAGSIVSAFASPAAAIELGLSQVGPTCSQFFIPSQMTSGDVPLTITNNSGASVLVAWINFAGNATVLGQLSPGDTFQDISRPQHVWVVMDGNLNCLTGYQLGLIRADFYVR